jgi:hypothetical protein
MRFRTVLPGLILAATWCAASGANGTATQPNTIDTLTDPGWQRYRERLVQLRKNPPPDELVSIGGSTRHPLRRMAYWLKAEPPQRNERGVFRRVTAFLEDEAGNRVRTLPDDVRFTAESGAELMPREIQPTRDGQADCLVLFATHPSTVSLHVWAKPGAEALPVHAHVLSGAARLPLFLEPIDYKGFTVQPRDAAVQKKLLEEARESAAGRKLFHARRIVTARARVFLDAGDSKAAREAFRLGVEEFDSPVCAWGEIQMLRFEGKDEEADRKAAALLKRHPRSVPAQFLNPAVGEQWWTPFNYYFQTYQNTKS